MEPHTPTPAERFAMKMEELRPELGTGPLAALVWKLLTCLLNLFASLADREPDQQARQDGAGAQDDAGADRRYAPAGSAPRQSNAGARAVVGATAVTAAGVLMTDGTPREDCLRHESGARAAREPRLPRTTNPTAENPAVKAGFSRLFSKKPRLEPGQNCGYFVTISKR